MTNEQAEALGRRWIAAGGGWREGMRASCYADWGRVTRMFTDDDGTQMAYVSWDHEASSGELSDYGADAWPDLRDAATRGAALEVVRERWGEPALQVSPRMHFERSVMDKGVLAGWAYYVNDLDEHSGRAPSEAEALVKALEAAPKERG